MPRRTTRHWQLLRYDVGHQETPEGRQEVLAFLRANLEPDGSPSSRLAAWLAAATAPGSPSCTAEAIAPSYRTTIARLTRATSRLPADATSLRTSPCSHSRLPAPHRLAGGVRGIGQLAHRVQERTAAGTSCCVPTPPPARRAHAGRLARPYGRCAPRPGPSIPGRARRGRRPRARLSRRSGNRGRPSPRRLRPAAGRCRRRAALFVEELARRVEDPPLDAHRRCLVLPGTPALFHDGHALQYRPWVYFVV